MEILQSLMTRRRFLQVTGATGAAAAGGAGVSQFVGLSTLSEAQAQTGPVSDRTVINKSICHQCPARCGIDVYTDTASNRVYAIYGTSDHRSEGRR